MEIIFLGTSAMVPTKDRNHFAFFVKYKNEGMLFDCGEGTQRQLRIAGIKPSKITKIFISHFHGDHILGLPGLLQTMSASQYEGTLRIYGQKGLREMISKISDLFPFDNKLDLEVVEITKTRFIDHPDYYVEAYKLEHGVPCIGYRLAEKDRLRIDMEKAKKHGLKQGPALGRIQNNESVEIDGKTIRPEDVAYAVPGRIIGFIADTVMTTNCMKIAQDADILISESTHSSRHAEKAETYKHFTAKQAAFVAHQANVKKLVLTHFSQRYKNIQEVVDDAKDLFPDTVASYDFMKIKI